MRVPQIDFLKGLAIIAVLLLHFSNVDSNSPISVFLLSQAVPIFIILFGYNSYLSFKEKYTKDLFGEFYQKYLQTKLIRFVIPFFLISIPIVYLTLQTLNPLIYVLNLIFSIKNLFTTTILPIAGPGAYFIAILFQLIMLFPIIAWLYQKQPKITLIVSFLLNLWFQTLPVELSYTSAFRVIFALALGMWLAERKPNLSDYWAILGIVIGLITLLLYGHSSIDNVFSFGYPLFLVMLGLRFLPRVNLIELLGKWSYHIYLLQLFVFHFIWKGL